MSDDTWIDRHSVNCYRCGALVDERNCVPNIKEYGGNDDGGELCEECLSKCLVWAAHIRKHS